MKRLKDTYYTLEPSGGRLMPVSAVRFFYAINFHIQLITILGSLIILKLKQKLLIQPNDFINDLHALICDYQHGLHNYIQSLINGVLQGTI